MIVNTAYMYMGKGSEPANPTIFNGKVYNYQYEANGVTENVNGFLFSSTGDITFLNMDLTAFSTVTVSAFHRSSREQYLKISILKADGSESPEKTLTFPRDQTASRNWTIPDGYKLKNVKLKLQAVNNSSQVTAKSAILS